ncbi:MAG TPA: EfeM/EfeO family lipoprotein [Mycobacteriales bacterium]|nr:EfeM/EfeO family lipoprotein [Mycobacteriales bacterium]
MRTPAFVLAALLGLGTTLAPANVAAAPAHVTRAGAAPRPLQPSDLAPALRKYRHYVHGKVDALVPAVRALRARIGAGDRAAAEEAWLEARLIWLRIGQDNSAYGVFGDLGQRIDGTAAGHDGGVRSAKFTGFHRVEWDLWRRHSLAAARTDSAKLASAVAALTHVSLKKAIPTDVDGASGFVLRSHEIIEDAVRDSLSGNDEYGSGTALASVTADVQATRKVLNLLAPLIKQRRAHLVAKARHDLSRLTAVARTGRHHGHWTAIKALSRRQRQTINAAAGQADERLAPIPDLLRIGNT